MGYFGLSSEQAEAVLAEYKRDIDIFEFFDKVVLSYDPSKSGFEQWSTSQVWYYGKADIGRIIEKLKITHQMPINDSGEPIEFPDTASPSVENRMISNEKKEYFRYCLQQLKETEPENYAVFVLYASKEMPQLETKVILEGLQFVGNMREELQDQKRGQPDYEDWFKQSTAIWERFGCLVETDQKRKELFDAQKVSRDDLLNSGYTEMEVKQFEVTSKYRTIFRMKQEKDEWNRKGIINKVKEIDFMIDWFYYSETEDKRFKAFETLDKLIQVEISTLLNIIQGTVAKKYKAAILSLTLCLKDKGWQ